jgi:maleylpyruvate isomerase
LADICLIPQLYNAVRFHCDLTAYPTLTRIDTNCKKISAFMKAFPNEPVA